MFQLYPHKLLASCALILVVTGCVGTESNRAVSLRLELADTSAIARLDYEIVGGGLPTGATLSGQIDIVGPLASVVLDLPEGTAYGLTLLGFDSADAQICVGTGAFDIIADTATNVAITLICSTTEGQPQGTIMVDGTFDLNTCPVIEELTVDPQVVLQGGMTTVTVMAREPDMNPMTYSWTTAGNGTFGDATMPMTMYTCVDGSSQTITISVSDGDPACVQRRNLIVDCTGNQCGGMMPVDCDDGNKCTINPPCEPISGTCPPATPTAMGTACDFAGVDDGLCDGAGMCLQCFTDTDCPDDGNDCTAPAVCGMGGICDAPLNEPLDTPCDNGGGPGSGVCDGAGVCTGNLCLGPPPVVCDDGNQCTVDPACVPLTGVCPPTTPAALGTVCDLVGTGDGVCDGNGNCFGCVTNADCPDDMNSCTTPSICIAGACTTPMDVAQGIVCDFVGTGDGVCDGAGACVDNACEAPTVVCDDMNLCTTDPACEPVTGTCPTPIPVAAGAVCDLVGTGDGVCDGAGICVECVSDTDCPDDMNECTTPSTCGANVCSTPMNVAALTVCDAGGGPGSGVCDGAGTCADNLCEGPPVVCDDMNLCTTDPACEPLTGACPTPIPTALGTICDLVGTGDGLCDGAGTCVECNVDGDCPDDGNDCTQPALCTANACAPPVNEPIGTACNNGGPGFCDGAGVCSSDLCAGPPPVVCDDANQCTNDPPCEPSTGNCPTPTNEPAGTVCDLVGTGDGLCDGSGACVECNIDDDCTDGNDCTITPCTANACGTTSNLPAATPCDAGGGTGTGECDGSGVCGDIDECALGTDNCDVNATCANTVGSFTCTCNTGYSGDGVTCTPAVVTGVTPAGELPGTSVTLSGTGFFDGMSVDFGGVVVTPGNVTATTADMLLPTLPPGDVNVVGTAGTAAFVYTMGPTITSITPDGAAFGTMLTVTGTGFRAGNVGCPQTGLRGVDNGSQTFTPPAFAGNTIFPAGDIAVDSNGYVSVAGTAAAGTGTNTTIPNAGNTAEIFYPFWDDLDNAPPVGQVYVAERLVRGVNTLIIQWDDFGYLGNVGNATFQVQIHENGATGGVLATFAYLDVLFGNPSDGGGRATIGYQQNATTADEFAFDPGSAVVANGDIIEITATAGGGNVVDFAQSNDPAAFVDIMSDSDTFLTWTGAGLPSCLSFVSTTQAVAEVPLAMTGPDTVTVTVAGRESATGVVYTAP